MKDDDRENQLLGEQCGAVEGDAEASAALVKGLGEWRSFRRSDAGVPDESEWLALGGLLS